MSLNFYSYIAFQIYKNKPSNKITFPIRSTGSGNINNSFINEKIQ